MELKLDNTAPGVTFDLRRLRADEHSRFVNSALNGKSQMPPWRGVLDLETDRRDLDLYPGHRGSMRHRIKNLADFPFRAACSIGATGRWRFLRHGAKHDVWTDGERQEPVPRHTEINEKLARAILRRASRKD